MSRALCHFTEIPVSATVGRGQQIDAAELKQVAESPFADPGFLQDWRVGSVGVWMWDRAAIEQAIGAAGWNPARVRILPETVLQERGGDEARLLHLTDGIEAQIWQDGVLRASRLFRAMPDEAAWHRFQRAAAVPPSMFQANLPQPSEPAWIERPWCAGPARFGRLAELGAGRFGAARIAAVAAILALLPLAWSAGQLLRLSQVDAQLAAAEAQGSEVAGPLAVARTQALADQDAMQAMAAAMDRYPNQLTLLARISERLPEGARIAEWSWQAGDLTLTATGPEMLDAARMVRTLSELPLLSDVQADRALDGRGLQIRARVKKTT